MFLKNDKIHEECGVFGIYSPNGGNVAMSTYYALYALQHRGQASCGIAVNDKGVIDVYKGMGLVPDAIKNETLSKMEGQIAVGHVRYSTNENNDIENALPLRIRHVKGNLALANNSSIINADELRHNLELLGTIFTTKSDAEIISNILVRERLRQPSIEAALQSSMRILKGAYCLVLMSPQKLIAARDPNGFRPLCMGERDGEIIFASESCVIDSLGAKFIRDVEPGEIVIVDKNGIRSLKIESAKKSSLCIFEFIYFARPDSTIDGQSVHYARINAGKTLAKEHPVEADIVIGVPDSGLDAALGYSMESKIPYEIGLVKNRYIGRTFIQPTQKERERAVRLKLNANPSVVKGKRVVMIDDSIVRGTTSARIVSILREAGATEVHMRVSSPPFLFPCHFGTDIASKDALIANNLTIEQIRQQIGVDSLGYLSIDALKDIAPDVCRGFCDACFTGNYPVKVPESLTVEGYVSKFDKKID